MSGLGNLRAAAAEADPDDPGHLHAVQIMVSVLGFMVDTDCCQECIAKVESVTELAGLLPDGYTRQ